MPFIQTIDAHSLLILSAISRFAFLRLKDLHSFLPVFTESGLRRAVNLLRREGHLAETLDADRCLVFALSPRGATALRKAGYPASTTAKYLNCGNYAHRTLANEVAILHASDFTNSIITEHEIQQGKHPLVYAFGKMPDYLVKHQDLGWLWGEVERSKRSTKDWRFLLGWLSQLVSCPQGHLPELFPDGFIFRIEFVCDPSFERKLVNAVGQDFADSWLYFRPINGLTPGSLLA